MYELGEQHRGDQLEPTFADCRASVVTEIRDSDVFVGRHRVTLPAPAFGAYTVRTAMNDATLGDFDDAAFSRFEVAGVSWFTMCQGHLFQCS